MTFIHWLWERTLLQAGIFFLVVNALTVVGSVLLCWLLGRAFASKRLFSVWEPLRPIEITAAILSVFFNGAVSICGWLLWKNHFLVLRDKAAWLMVLDIVVMLLTMDFLMYCFHWLVHRQWIYPLFHTFHHRHEKTNPISLFVLHPVEVLGFGFLMIAFLVAYPMSGPALIIYLALNILWGTLGHSGVEPFPSLTQRLPVLRLLGTSTFHAGHHETQNFNFGFYTLFWDKVFGTLRPDYHDRFRDVSADSKR